jgi:hypothetical protein
MQKVTKPYDNPRIFWDVDYVNMDYSVRANFIIERVFDRGDVEDIRQCRRYYGDAKTAATLLNAKYLSEPSIHLAAAIFDKPLNEFRCYILAQSDPQYWIY